MAQKALSFNGTSDYVTVPHFALGNVFSVELWLKQSAESTNYYEQNLVCTHDWSVKTGFIVGRCGKRYLVFRVGSGSAVNDLNMVGTWNLDTWVYVVCVWDGTDQIIYINGVENTRTTPGLTYAHGDDPIDIGRDITYTARVFDGIIDEVRISNVMRTLPEIEAIWNGGNGVRFEVDGNTIALWHMNEGADSTIYDETANYNDGTITGASWVDGYAFTILRTASVMIGVVATGTRLGAFTRASSVIVGIVASASRTAAYTRVASVIIGVVAIAEFIWRAIKLSLGKRHTSLTLPERTFSFTLPKRIFSFTLRRKNE